MGKNKGMGGSRFKKNKNSSSILGVTSRELIFKTEEQEYGKIEKLMGNNRVEVICDDGEKRLCSIRGSMRRKVWMVKDDVVLISLRDYQEGKADIIHKYNHDEVRALKSYGELSSINTTSEFSENDKDDNMFVYDAEDESVASTVKSQPEILPIVDDDDEIDIDNI